MVLRMLARNDKIFAKERGKSKVTGGMIVICGDCINAAYVADVIWCRFALFCSD